MDVIETARLRLRALTFDDADFIRALLNEPGWIQYIGDRQVRSLEDARAYLARGPLAMYAEHGFGLLCIEERSTATRVGICGLIRRPTLADVDLGYALLAQFHGRGYAAEAAAAVLQHGVRTLGLARIVAVTSLDNARSIALLEKLGFRFERTIPLPGYSGESRLYAFAAVTRE